MILLLACASPPPSPGVVFVGDVSLARGVAEEAVRRPGSPWAAFPATGDRWVGNLEGTLAEGACGKAPELCLGIPPEAFERLRGSPFSVLSVANNHRLDHGGDAARHTVGALAALGITALEPGVARRVSVGGLDLALVGVDLSGPGAAENLEEALLVVGKAAAETPWVVVLPHGGIEGVAGLGPGQEAAAERLHAWGARLVVGSGAHVIQGHACGPDGATWYGLGDHLFDQRPEGTWTGALLRCHLEADGLVCDESRTRRTSRSTFPEPVPGVVASCTIPAPPDPDRAWTTHAWRDHFVVVQPFPAAGDGAWFALHRHRSDLDDEDGLRPYVFRREGEQWVDVWRGSSLARPLVAAQLLDVGGRTRLCAIHRDDSFLQPDSTTKGRVRLVYEWTGFGFRGVDEPDATLACAAL